MRQKRKDGKCKYFETCYGIHDDEDDNNNNNEKIFYLSIFDDGNGIDSENFNKIFYLNNFNENTFIDDKDNKSFLTNINIKCNLLRLCDSFIIISKTKNEMNVGLISKNFQFNTFIKSKISRQRKF